MTETLFLVLVFLLLALAIFDLIVGVSNDAVNFLTSAIGSKAGSFKLIMIVASIGIFVGAVSAGGMMEVARKGLFFPDRFTFQDVIFIYVVVMLSDVLLLDVFNSLKLPTSTTVSIVFELLGASMAISLLNMYHGDVALSEWGDYINATKAFQKIAAIFVSVGIAFAFGWLIQFALRSMVTFDYERFKRFGGSLFGAISVVIVLNFIINVAFKNSPLKEWETIQWMIQNFWMVALPVFVVTGGVFYTLSAGKFDPFKFITFLGTFALAMAFASNDLVNFIGVPVASYDAFVLWQGTGVPADEFYMTPFMEEGLPANQLFLILAGVIMATTLWLSKKARRVIQTSVSLSRQQEGEERFKPNSAVRFVVKGTTRAADLFIKLVPHQVVNVIDNRFNRKPIMELKEDDAPAFDMVRASVNLMVAALVISWGTAYKLPLSTTYVSFMVLMGTSLADRAWNRDSAVYRVSGVFAVIGGWFVTAIAAISLSALFAFIIFSWHFVGVGLVIVLVIISIFLVNKYTAEPKPIASKSALPKHWQEQSTQQMNDAFQKHAEEILSDFGSYMDQVFNALKDEEPKALDKQFRTWNWHKAEAVNRQSQLTVQLKGLPDDKARLGNVLMRLARIETGLFSEMAQLAADGRDHVLNLHDSLDAHQIQCLEDLNVSFHRFLKHYKRALYASDVERPDVNTLNTSVYASIELQIEGLIAERYNFKNSLMYFDYLDAMRDCMRMLEEIQTLVRKEVLNS